VTIEVELSALSRDALKKRWREIIGEAPPPRLGRGTMIRVLACEIQWKASAQNRAAIRRLLKKALATDSSNTVGVREGVRFVRDWNGVRHVVDVTESGYLWNDKPWRSLSAIAREITGARWSGPRFFGVKS